MPARRGGLAGRTLWAVTTESIDDRVDAAERNHLRRSVEAQFVEYTHTAAFRFVGKHRAGLADDEMVAALRRSSQGSIRVALLARKRARETWDLNPADAEAAEAYRLLTLLAASFLPEDSSSGRLNYA